MTGRRALRLCRTFLVVVAVLGLAAGVVLIYVRALEAGVICLTLILPVIFAAWVCDPDVPGPLRRRPDSVTVPAGHLMSPPSRRRPPEAVPRPAYVIDLEVAEFARQISDWNRNGGKS